MNADSKKAIGANIEIEHIPRRELKLSQLTDKVISVFYQVYNELGPGFLESVYENSMAIALRDAGFAVNQQVPLEVFFRNQLVGEFRADLIVEGALLIELKAARAMESVFEAQVLNYLRATNLEVGLLMNFGNKPDFRRLVYDNLRKTASHSKPQSDADFTQDQVEIRVDPR